MKDDWTVKVEGLWRKFGTSARGALKYGVIGQETTGPGGFMKALRTVPQVLEVAHTMEKVAPDAFLINFTNPSGLVTEAALRFALGRLGIVDNDVVDFSNLQRQVLHGTKSVGRSKCKSARETKQK